MSKVLLVKGIYSIFCPACEVFHLIDTRWRFNYDFIKPSFQEPVQCEVGPFEAGHKHEFKTIVCHFLIRNGTIRYLERCTHEFVGHTMELPEVMMNRPADELKEKMEDEKDMGDANNHQLPSATVQLERRLKRAESDIAALKDALGKTVSDRDTLSKLVGEAYNELIWCSGSADFGTGGQAREGWLKGPAKWMEKVSAIMKAAQPHQNPKKTLDMPPPLVKDQPVPCNICRTGKENKESRGYHKECWVAMLEPGETQTQL